MPDMSGRNGQLRPIMDLPRSEVVDLAVHAAVRNELDQIKRVYEQMTGQPFNDRARKAMGILAGYLFDGASTMYHARGADGKAALEWISGECKMLADEWCPKGHGQVDPDVVPEEEGTPGTVSTFERPLVEEVDGESYEAGYEYPDEPQLDV